MVRRRIFRQRSDITGQTGAVSGHRAAGRGRRPGQRTEELFRVGRRRQDVRESDAQGIATTDIADGDGEFHVPTWNTDGSDGRLDDLQLGRNIVVDQGAGLVVADRQVDGSVGRTVTTPGTRLIARPGRFRRGIRVRVETVRRFRHHGRVVYEQSEITDRQDTTVVVGDLLDEGQNRLDVIVGDRTDGRLAQVERNKITDLRARSGTGPGRRCVAGGAGLEKRISTGGEIAATDDTADSEDRRRTGRR